MPDGPEDILGGDEKKQIEALRDYVLTLHKASEQQRAVGRSAGGAGATRWRSERQM